MIRAALAFLAGAVAGALAVAWVVAPARRHVDCMMGAPYKIEPARYHCIIKPGGVYEQ